MKDYVETAYEDVCMIVLSSLDNESREAAMISLAKRLEGTSAVLEDMFYERLGISLDEIVDMLGMDAVLV